MKALATFASERIHKEPVDMGRGINGLCALVEQAQMGVLSGNPLFVFTSKLRDSIKVLYFDKSGFCLWQKRLEKDKFSWPKKLTDTTLKITSEQLQWLIDG